MPEGHMLNTSLSTSRGFASLSPEAAVLFCMIIPHLNNQGKMRAEGGLVKYTCCPFVRYINEDNVQPLLEEISKKTNLKWFRDEKGDYYLHSVSWERHQNLRWSRHGRDKMPSYSGTTPVPLPEDSGTTPAEEKEEKRREGREGGRSAATAPAAPKPKSDAQALLDHHARAYEQSVGAKLLINGPKDMNLCKRMVAAYGLEKAIAISDQMFKSADPFVSKTGFTIGALHGCAPKLVIEIGQSPTKFDPETSKALKFLRGE